MGDEPIDDVTNKKSLADELAKLADLVERGVLTREEFEDQKAALLRSASGGHGQPNADSDLIGPAYPAQPSMFTNADRLRVLANLPPAKMIWSGVFFLVLGSFAGSAFFTFLGTALFFIGIVLSQIKPTS